MEQKLAELYNKLAKQIIRMIPVKWSEVYYLGEVQKGKLSISSVFYFMDSERRVMIHSGRIPQVYNVSRDVYRAFSNELNDILEELYECFLENEQEPWERLSMFLGSNGKFKIDYQYDVFEEGKGPVARQVIWAYETFGRIPEEGSFQKNILDKYLATKNQ